MLLQANVRVFQRIQHSSYLANEKNFQTNVRGFQITGHISLIFHAYHDNFLMA